MIAIPFALLLLVLAEQPAPATSAVPATATPASTPAATPVATLTPAATAPTATATATGAAPASAMPASAKPASATPAAAATPSAPPAEQPTALPYGYRFVPRQPDHPAAGQPQIFAVYLNSNKLKSQGPIDIKVATSPDVVKVMTVSNGHEGIIPMIDRGDFEAIGKLPKLPIIASGVSTTLNFVAIAANGKRVTVPVPVLLQ